MSKKIYTDNGLPFWTQQDIQNRNYITDTLSLAVAQALLFENRGWIFERVEAPCLIPVEYVSEEYTMDEFFAIAFLKDRPSLVLRPETTAASYEYAKHQFEHQIVNPPYCVWQLNKSFRNENDQVTKNMRYKEFYQLEFQCIYTSETKNDYHKAVLEPLMWAVNNLTKLPTRLVPSDRTPSYSYKTVDIEVDMGYKWLEVCSISLRDDVPFKWNNKELSNVEVAFGADRLTEILNKENRNDLRPSDTGLPESDSANNTGISGDEAPS